MIKRKIYFSFYRRKGALNRTRFKEARLVAYASLQKFSKYTYYLGSEPKLTQKPLSSNLYNEMWIKNCPVALIIWYNKLKMYEGKG